MNTLSKMRARIGWDRFAEFLNQRSPREKVMFLAFGAILLLSADYFLWLGPVVKHLSESVPALASEEAELQNLREDKRNAADIRARYDRVQSELESREKAVEAANQIPALLENLSKLAGRSGVRITSLSPLESSAPANGKFYAPLPIEIKAQAGTHELGKFIESLEIGDTAFKVLDLKINPSSGNPKKHAIEMKVETYRKASSS